MLFGRYKGPPRTLAVPSWKPGFLIGGVGRREDRTLRRPELIEADIDCAGAKPGFAIAKVILPHPLKARVEAELAYGRPRGEESLAPCGECAGVTRTKRLLSDQSEARANRVIAIFSTVGSMPLGKIWR